MFDNVLVTGAGGLLGGYVVRELADSGSVTGQITGLDLSARADGGACAIGAVTDLDTVRKAVAGRDAVVHVAARPNIWSGTSEDIIRVNTLAVVPAG